MLSRVGPFLLGHHQEPAQHLHLRCCRKSDHHPGIANYTYDAENHLVSAGGLNYSYDGDGKRVMKSNGILYWYGAGSDPLFESDTSGYQIFKHFYFNGMRVARQEGWSHGSWMDHYVSDALGNARFVYGYNGAWDVSDYYPFGGERPYQSQEGNVFKFTGKERDSESGLDNFGARYMASSLGRFMSPDWSESPTPVPYASLPYPQSLNLYSYVQNNPLSHTDPNGHCDVDGEHHNWVWCAAHTLGLGVETKKETAAREAQAAKNLAEFQAWRRQQIKETGVDPMVTFYALGAAYGGAMAGFGGLLDEGAVAPVEPEAEPPGTPRATANGVPQPNANGEIVVGPNGTAVKIPAGYVAEPAANGNGIVYRPAGSTGNANTIRIMGPDAQGRYPSGYVRTYNSSGQPVVPSTGKPGTQAQTHTPF